MTPSAGLPAMVDRAASSLAGARTAAEILEAKEMAGATYDAGKRAKRLARAKGAHDELIGSIHRAQADALEIEAAAKRRLADEYDAAQERGEVPSHGGDRKINVPNGSVEALGISRKDIHEARQVRDAEAASPGVVKAAVTEAVEAGEEPTRAKVRRAIAKVAKKRKPKAKPRPAIVLSEHDRDLQMLMGVWQAACSSARMEFQRIINEAKN